MFVPCQGVGANGRVGTARAWSVALALLTVVCGPRWLLAQALPPSASDRTAAVSGADPQLVEKMRKRGDLTLRDTTLTQALFTISQTWDVNLVVGSEVEGQVNGVFRDAPLYEILDSILLANGYGYRPVGQGLVVRKLDQLGDANPLFQTITLRLRALKPEDILPGAQLLNSPQGRVHAIPSANCLLVTDFPDRLQSIRNFVRELDDTAVATGGSATDQPLQFADFHTQFVDAKSIKESAQMLLSKDGKVAVMDGENRLVVSDYPSNLRLIGEMVQRLDVPPPQVRITALIYDISLEDIERLGLNWKHANKFNNDLTNTPATTFQIDSFLAVPVQATDTHGLVTMMNLSRNFDVTAIIDALRKCDDARLLADPSVTVINRQEASIQIVTEIPYQQLTQTSQGGSIGTTAFREAGVTLQVTPTIARDSTLQMNVTPSFSRLTGFTTGQNPQPIIDKREAKTTVRVADRQTLVIGGLRQRTDLGSFRGLPHLMHLKAMGVDIGALFRGRSNTVRESELIVFLTPEILTPCENVTPRGVPALGKSHELLERIPIATDVIVPTTACGPQAHKYGGWQYPGPHYTTPAQELGPYQYQEYSPPVEGLPPPVATPPRTETSPAPGPDLLNPPAPEDLEARRRAASAAAMVATRPDDNRLWNAWPRSSAPPAGPSPPAATRETKPTLPAALTQSPHAGLRRIPVVPEEASAPRTATRNKAELQSANPWLKNLFR